jgi:hypothetical protein
MKHILNNLSEEEKNAIREQHEGGMKVMTENFSKLINSKLGDSKPLVNEQPAVPPPPRPGVGRKTPQTTPPAPAPSTVSSTTDPNNQYKQPPYCKIGQSKGTVVTAQTGTSGPNTALGETGLALSVNGKVVCLISTKYTQGGYVTSQSR